MTIRVSDVEDVIASLGDEGSCGTLPVCLCTYPVEVWIAYAKLFALAQSTQDLVQLKNILCCLKIGSGTFTTPDTPTPSTGGGTTTGGGGKPTGTGGGGTVDPKWDSGMSVPEGTGCANFLTAEFCGPAGKTSLKTLSLALSLMALMPETADFATSVTGLKDAIDGALALCDADPSFAGTIALEKIKVLCEKVKSFPLDKKIPGIGYIGDIPFITKLLNNCCDKI